MFAIVVAVVLVAVACADDDNGNSSGTTATTQSFPCTLLGDKKFLADPSDASSIEVFVGNDGFYTPGVASSQWCDVTELDIVRLTQAELDTIITGEGGAGCPGAPTRTDNCPYIALAAVDVKPDGVVFAPPNANQPVIEYDLSIDNKSCSSFSGCIYTIYQLVAGTWDAASSASSGAATPDLVSGFMDHFSIFVLVELPESERLIPDFVLERLRVESRWLSDDTGPVLISLSSEADYPVPVERGERNVIVGVEPLYRFEFLDEARDIVATDVNPDCLAETDPGSLLTCAFPSQTLVKVITEGELVVIIADEGQVEFLATVELH